MFMDDYEFTNDMEKKDLLLRPMETMVVVLTSHYVQSRFRKSLVSGPFF